MRSDLICSCYATIAARCSCSVLSASISGFQCYVFTILALSFCFANPYCSIVPTVRAQDSLVEANSQSPVRLDRIPLSVEELDRLADGNFRVKLFGSEKVVDALLLDDYVVSRYLEFPQFDKNVDVDQIIAYLSKAGEERSPFVSGKLLALALRNESFEDSSVEQLVEKLLQADDGAEILREAVLTFKGIPPIRVAVLELYFQLALIDRKWLKKNDLKGIYRLDNDFRSYLVKKYAERASAGEIEQASAIVSLSTYLFGSEASTSQQLNKVKSKVEQNLSDIEATEDEEDLDSLLEQIREDPELASMLNPLLLKKLHDEAERSLQEGQADRALSFVTRVDPRQRSPRTLRIFREALERLEPSDSPFIFDRKLLSIVEDAAKADTVIQDSYFQFVQRQVDYFIFRRSSEKLDLLLYPVLRTRPDPHPENDLIRFRHAILLFEQGETKRAGQKLQLIQSELTLGQKWQLLKVGYYPMSTVVGIVLALVAFFFLVIVVLRDRRRRRKLAEQIRARKEGGEGDDDDLEGTQDPIQDLEDTQEGMLTSFKGRPLRGHGLDPRLQEYRILLQRLELGEGADLRMIKTAYRSKIKDLHPDSHSGDDSESSEDFMRLKETYEKIISLRKQLGYSDKA